MPDITPIGSPASRQAVIEAEGSMTYGSLFAGIGGMDLGLDRAGMTCKWQCEIDKHALEILERHWPAVRRWGPVQDCDPEAVGVLAGGDPCPSRSRARGNRPSKHPDLSGYFLAVAARLRPRWVVRENVPAPDALWFAVGLEALGYRCASLSLDSRDFTGQSRRRQFLLGCPPDLYSRFARAVFDAADDFGFVPSSDREETPITACLTAHGMRLAAEDTYCFEPERGLRVLAAEEAEALQGFPRGWTAGFAERRRRAMCGRAVTVPVAQWIGERILEAEQRS